MGRIAVWVVLGLAIAGIAVFALTSGESKRDDGELALGDPDVSPEDDGQAPELIGSGRSAPAATASTGRYTIEGKVTDAEGNALGGVAVVALNAGPAWIPGDPSSWNWIEGQFASRVETLDHPERERFPLVSRTESAEDGSFTLRLADAAKYEVHARPESPRIGTYSEVSVYDKKPDQETSLYVLDGAPLSGRVVDADDRPVPCVLRATWWEGQTMGQPRRWRSGPVEVPAPDATFAIPAVPEGSLQLSVILKGERTLSGFTVKSPHEGEYVLRIPSSGSGVKGIVTDTAKQAVAGATILVSVTAPKTGDGPAATSEVKALSAADGSYLATGLPAGEVTWMRAKAKGFLTLSQYKDQAPWSGAKVEDGKTVEVDLTLERGGSVRGRVLVKEKNTPIAGARVRLLRSQQGGAMSAGGGRLTVTTGADGSYEIEGLASGRYVALADHKDHYLPELAGERGPNYVMPGMSRTAPPSITVVITGDDSKIERDLFLLPGVALNGRVEDGAARGIEGAEVNARNFGLGNVAWQWGIGGVANESLATSEKDGSFKTVAMPPREDWVFYAKKENLVGSFSEPVAISMGAPAPSLKLTMKPGATIRGKVIGDDTKAIAQAQVGVWGPHSELRHDTSYKKTNADGTFELTGIPPGDWTLNIWMNGRQGVQQQIKDLKEGEVREGIELELASGVRVSGVVVDEEGKGVANTYLYLRSGNSMVNTRTDAEGKFTFEGVKEGSCQIMIWHSGRNQELGDKFDAPAENLRVVYEKEPTVVISGEVHDEAGNPIPLCNVKVTSGKSQRGQPQMYYGDQGGVEAINGKFRKEVPATEPYKVSVSNPRDEQGRPLNLTAKTTTVTDPGKPVIITLEGGLEVRGRVADAANKPVTDVSLQCNNISAQPDSNGEYVIRGLRKGTVAVKVMVKGSWIRPKEKKVAAGSRNVDFVLEKGMKIRGKAFKPNGEPLTRGYVNANWSGVGDYPGGHAGSQLGPKGTFTVDGLPPSAVVKITVQSWNYGGGGESFAPQVIENVRPGTDDLEVTLGAGLTIEGTVVDAKGKPASNVYVNAHPVEQGQASGGFAQVGSDGKWKLSGLKPVRYRIMVHRQDGGAAPKAVEVDPPATGVRIVLPKTTTLSGRIEGLGEHAERWRVTAWHENGSSAGRAKVKEDGTFSFDTVADGGPLVLGARRSGDTRYALKEGVQPGTESCVLRLKEGMTISGTVDRGDAPADERGSVQAKGKYWHASAMISKEGDKFEIRGVPPGSYTLTMYLYTSNRRGVKRDVQAGSDNVRVTIDAK